MQKTNLNITLKTLEKNKKRGKKWSIDIIDVGMNKNHDWSTPNKILIPKDTGGFREVYKYNSIDAIKLKYINELCYENFKDSIPPYVFSYKEGVSTKKAAKYVNDKCKGFYILKIDIKNYFMSVKLSHIENCLTELFKDDDILNNMLTFFRDNRYIDTNGETTEGSLSLKPGNAFSAFLSNYVLKDIDTQINNRVKAYSRYSDDIIIADSSIDKLQETLLTIENLLKPLGLEINDSKSEIYKPNQPIDYLGYHIIWDNKFDISDKRFKREKALIKTICKEERQKMLSGGVSKEQILHNIIQRYNKRYYKTTENTKERYSWVQGVFPNINIPDRIIELDKYFINSCRIAYTGKNNKSNKSKLPITTLKNKGWLGLEAGYKLYFKDKNLFNDVVSRVLSESECQIWE